MKLQMPDYDGIPQILQLNNGGRMFFLKYHDGEIRMTRYSVFPGIEMIYKDIHTENFCSDIMNRGRDLLEIDH